jgi:hypothetical protein
MTGARRKFYKRDFVPTAKPCLAPAVYVGSKFLLSPLFKKSGVDIMITIFYDFGQFSAFISKTNVTINFFQNLALF